MTRDRIRRMSVRELDDFRVIEWEGGTIAFGLDGDGDPFVSVNTEDAAEGMNDPDGNPLVLVYLNDATLYDPETYEARR